MRSDTKAALIWWGIASMVVVMIVVCGGVLDAAL